MINLYKRCYNKKVNKQNYMNKIIYYMKQKMLKRNNSYKRYIMNNQILILLILEKK